MFNFKSINEASSFNKNIIKFSKQLLSDLTSSGCQVYATSKQGLRTPLALLSNDGVESLTRKIGAFPKFRFEGSDYGKTYATIYFYGSNGEYEDAIIYIGGYDEKRVEESTTYNVDVYDKKNNKESYDNLSYYEMITTITNDISRIAPPNYDMVQDYCSIDHLIDWREEMIDAADSYDDSEHPYKKAAIEGRSSLLNQAIKSCNTRIKEVETLIKLYRKRK